MRSVNIRIRLIKAVQVSRACLHTLASLSALFAVASLFGGCGGSTAYAAARERLLPWTQTQTITSLAFSPDGSLVAAGDGNGTVTLWDARTGRRFARLPG